MVIAALFARTLLLAYVFIPTLVAPADRINALLVVTVVMAFPNTLLGICFGPFFMSAVPGEWRGTVVGVRNALMSIISFVVTLLCGQLLVQLVFPVGYQVVFVIGFVGAVLTIYTLASVTCQFRSDIAMVAGDVQSLGVARGGRRGDHRSRATVCEVPAGLVSALRGLLPSRDPSGRHYLVVVFMLFGLNSVGYMAAPLLPDLTVNQLKLDDAVISVGSAVNSMLVFLISLFVARLTRRFGNRNATAVGAALLCFQTLILAMAQDAALFLASSVVGGLASGILMAAQFNYHLDNVPGLDQTAWISWSSFLGNIAALLGSVAGPALAGWLGISSTLAGLSLLRLLIGSAIFFWG